MSFDLFERLNSIIDNEPDFDDVYNCPLINQMKSTLRNIENPDTILMDSIDRIGKALREDYNEEYTPNLPNSEDIK